MNYAIKSSSDRAVLVGIGLRSDSVIELKESLSELVDLATSAGAEVVGQLFQHAESWNPATLMGVGKVEEVLELVKETGANVVIVDHHLSGVQIRNLEKAFGVSVFDRTQLILDIFAMRAQSHEGKLQVELAQLLDQSSRMVGAWHGSLSRQGGGIGTRGPGERALEYDRRTMRTRIQRIRRELELVSQSRAQHRIHRKRNKIPNFALIGYTNVGKSTILNKLTKSNVLVKDQVFATLDPTSRKIYLPEAPQAVVTDTVGFIRKLPTELIEAFKATLEETADADILLNVVDISHHEWKRQMEVVEELMKEFQWDKKPVIHIFNKMDQCPPDRKFQVKAYPRVFVSAHTGEGFDQLKQAMTSSLLQLYEEAQLFFPNQDRHLLFQLGRETQITRQEEGTQGVVAYAHMTPILLSKWNEYVIV